MSEQKNNEEYRVSATTAASAKWQVEDYTTNAQPQVGAQNCYIWPYGYPSYPSYPYQQTWSGSSITLGMGLSEQAKEEVRQVMREEFARYLEEGVRLVVRQEQEWVIEELVRRLTSSMHDVVQQEIKDYFDGLALPEKDYPL